MMISDLFGVPFVPTRHKNVYNIFKKIKIKKKDVFYDLGCGDGRLVFYITKTYGIKAVGVELNPLLYAYQLIKKKLTKNKLTQFYHKDIFKINFEQATIVYLFLFPEIVDRLVPKLIKQCNKNTLIISHGFEAKALKNKEFLKLKDKPFATYFYRL